MNIHPTAIIAHGAQVDQGVQVGPYCVIGAKVTLKKGVKVHSHVCIEGNTIIGEGTEIFPFASIGQRPQDLKYNGEDSRLLIGRNNVIREYVTIHPGTATGAMETVIGDDCLIMISVHIAHDCTVGDGVIMSNNASLAGHVDVGDRAVLGGMTGFKQFVRIGKNAIIGGGSMVDSDVIPYGQVSGERAQLTGLNLIGMQRAHIPKEGIRELQTAFQQIFHQDNESLAARAQGAADAHRNNAMVIELVDFIKRGCGKALCLPVHHSQQGDI